jgi:hypothetical protein
MGPPGWVVGPVVAIATLIAGMNSPLFAVGVIGFLLVPVIAMWAGAAAASIVDPRRRLNTTVVVAATLAALAMYLRILAVQPLPPGASRGGGRSVPAPAGWSPGAPPGPPPR